MHQSMCSECGIKPQMDGPSTGCVDCTADAMQALQELEDRADKIQICFWPDGTWCRREVIEEYSWKSDDYAVLTCPVEFTDEDISAEVNELVYSQLIHRRYT